MAKKKETTYCLECDGRVLVKSPRVGQTVICNHCGTKLEVVYTDPVELDWAFDSPSMEGKVVYTFAMDEDDNE